MLFSTARTQWLLFLCSFLFSFCLSALSESVHSFATQLSKERQLPLAAVESILNAAQLEPQVLERMAKPAEAMPWERYRTLFLSEDRIQGGKAFMAAHSSVFERAEKTYGVPAPIIAAVIGVETLYGKHKGKYNALNALYTLSFEGKERNMFFQKELKALIQLGLQEGWDFNDLQSSYAGALGMPQFMPSSYIHYAVDFNRDGKKDLFTDVEDIIGSVAYYLHANGWEAHKPVLIPIAMQAEQLLNLRDNKTLTFTSAKRPYTKQQLSELGLPLTDIKVLRTDEKVSLLSLEREAAPSLFVGCKNFEVITTYNRSPLYAMAVSQLAEAIANS